LASYQEEVLGNRDAWQFINPLTVKILSYKPRENRVDVEMKTSGRLLGTTWSLDADALMQYRIRAGFFCNAPERYSLPLLANSLRM
jgi:hypothetical protein